MPKFGSLFAWSLKFLVDSITFFAHYLIIIFIIIGAVALPRAHYGEGNGSIYLDELSCTGHEKFWWECQSYTAAHNCRHIEDVSVRCQAKSNALIYFFCD